MRVEDLYKIYRIGQGLGVSEIDPSKSISEIREHFFEREFEALKSFLNSDNWPAAVKHICTDENSKIVRAKDIIKKSGINFSGKKFLDFGCGEGHVVSALKDICAVSHGFDIEIQPTENQYFNNYTDLKTKYDVIFLCDVLDHVENPKELLNQAAGLLNPDGIIYILFHPWCSRHGSHLYKEINKAFIHLVFSEEELKKLGVQNIEKVSKVIHPLSDYKRLISKFKLHSEFVARQDVEPIFKSKLFCHRIISNWRHSSDKDIISGIKFPEFQMEQNFCEFIIKL